MGPTNTKISDTEIGSADPAMAIDGPPKLPTELMQRVVDHLYDIQAFSSLHELQQTSRSMYIMATPPMYREIGDGISHISRRFTPLLDVSGDDFEPVGGNEPVDGHPIEWTRVERLLWMYSHTRRIV